MHDLLYPRGTGNSPHWLLLADGLLSGIVQKAGDTPYRVIGNGFSER
jgi:hypothetical protein